MCVFIIYTRRGWVKREGTACARVCVRVCVGAWDGVLFFAERRRLT